MRYAELALPEHPLRSERPHDIARLYVSSTQYDQMRDLCAQHGPTQIIGVKPIAFDISIVEVLCPDPTVAMRLSEDWLAHIRTSPIRPRFNLDPSRC